MRREPRRIEERKGGRGEREEWFARPVFRGQASRRETTNQRQPTKEALIAAPEGAV